MNNLHTYLIALSIVLGAFSQGLSQDFHISQYDNSMQQLNPAYTGYDIEEDFRFNLNHRAQWSQITSKPFRSFLFSYDQKVNKRFNLGGYFNSNKAGDNNFSTFNAMISSSYNIIQDEASEHKLMVGLQLGILNRSLRSADYLYDVQYNNSKGVFDQEISSGEIFDQSSFTRFDGAMGVYYDYVNDEKTLNPFVGLSLLHIAFPNESVTLIKSVLPIRWIAYGGTDIKLNEKLSLKPNVLYMYQAGATDFNLGALGNYKINNSDYALLVGLNYRWNDAVIAHLGIKHKSNIFRVSYDFNTSYLKNYTGGRGGLEMSMIYIGAFKKSQELRKSRLLFK